MKKYACDYSVKIPGSMWREERRIPIGYLEVEAETFADARVKCKEIAMKEHNHIAVSVKVKELRKGG